MYALIGKTFNIDGHTFHSWVTCVSENPSALVNRKTEIEELLNRFNCFYTTTGPFVQKRNLLYNECLLIQNILNTSKLDLGCDYVNTAGIQYNIIKTTIL